MTTEQFHEKVCEALHAQDGGDFKFDGAFAYVSEHDRFQVIPVSALPAYVRERLQENGNASDDECEFATQVEWACEDYDKILIEGVPYDHDSSLYAVIDLVNA